MGLIVKYFVGHGQDYGCYLRRIANHWNILSRKVTSSIFFFIFFTGCGMESRLDETRVEGELGGCCNNPGKTWWLRRVVALRRAYILDIF